MRHICRDGQTYAGAYSLDKATGIITGCPARAPAIHDLMKAVKTRAGTKGAAATRKHAEAMSVEDLQKIMKWSEEKCPNELFDNAKPSAQHRSDEYAWPYAGIMSNSFRVDVKV